MTIFSEQHQPPTGRDETAGPQPRRPQGGSTAHARRNDRSPRPAVESRPGGRGQPAWHRNVGEPELPPDATTWRLFLAVEIPDEAKEEMAGLMDRLKPGVLELVRWTPRENVHLTLQFMGDADSSLVPKIEEQIRAAAGNSSPILLALGETGVFPHPADPKIVWIGLTGEVRRLVQLQGRLEGALRTLGFTPERRPFSPHITLGRVKRDITPKEAGDIGFGWRRVRLPPARAGVPVNEVVLYRSQLRQGGPIYEKLFGVRLDE